MQCCLFLLNLQDSGLLQVLKLFLSKFRCIIKRGIRIYFTMILISTVVSAGSMDGTVRVWEVETGRCLRVWNMDEAVKCVTWNPVRELPILAASV